jgi:hypothetical protein
MKFLNVLILCATLSGLFQTSNAHAFEMLGMIAYDGAINTPTPSTFQKSGGGIGYDFFGRLALGPGFMESGFLFTQTSITTNEPFGTVKTSGSFWIIPLLYRIYVLPPFLSIALGPDYAVLGTNAISIHDSSVGTGTGGYHSHFGLEGSIEAVQDVGENLGIVVDLRYRRGLANAIILDGTSVRYDSFMISLGIQKQLQ